MLPDRPARSLRVRSRRMDGLLGPIGNGCDRRFVADVARGGDICPPDEFPDPASGPPEGDPALETWRVYRDQFEAAVTDRTTHGDEESLPDLLCQAVVDVFKVDGAAISV